MFVCAGSKDDLQDKSGMRENHEPGEVMRMAVQFALVWLNARLQYEGLVDSGETMSGCLNPESGNPNDEPFKRFNTVFEGMWNAMAASEGKAPKS
jgi:hypothetical protein